jgi:parvulin-like peptidyl-prolyl isomerase
MLYQILTKDKETALRIRGLLDNNPQRFEEIAKKESISVEASKGGLMGYFEEGTLPKDMEQVVFSLQPNTISPVVESSYGFHIFKISQKKKGRLLFLDKVRDEIKQKLTAEKLRNAYREFLNTTNQGLTIEIKHDNLYFKYQNIEGDEIKQTSNSGNLSSSSD